MVLIGLLLVLLALAVGVLLFLGTQSISTPVDLEVAGQHVGLTPLAMWIAGATAMLLLVMGLAMVRAARRRRRRPRREAKEAQRRAELEESVRADERKRADEEHQRVLGDRDRAHEEELRSRLDERDRARDEELSASRAEEERRIRADERARMERELAIGGAAATRSHADTASESGGDRRTEVFDTADARDTTHSVGGAETQTRTQSDDLAEDDDNRAEHHDERMESGDSGQLDNGSTSDDRPDSEGSSDSENRTDSEDGGDDGGSRPAHRTVADRIMGREPRER